MSKFFLRLIKLHEPEGECNFWSLKKFTCAYLFQTAGEKLCINNIHGKKRDNLIMQMQSMCIKCKNNLFKACK